MAIYTVREDFIEVIGNIWGGGKATHKYYIHDLDSLGDFKDRKVVAKWLRKAAGDFESIDDFRVSVGEYEGEWEKEESRQIFINSVGGETPEVPFDWN